jgi:hypothetical protein
MSTKKVNPSRKDGLKTSEFWLSLLSAVITLVIIAGVADPEGEQITDKVVGVISVALTSLGYTVSRSFLKGKAADASLDH